MTDGIDIIAGRVCNVRDVVAFGGPGADPLGIAPDHVVDADEHTAQLAKTVSASRGAWADEESATIVGYEREPGGVDLIREACVALDEFDATVVMHALDPHARDVLWPAVRDWPVMTLARETWDVVEELLAGDGALP